MNRRTRRVTERLNRRLQKIEDFHAARRVENQRRIATIIAREHAAGRRLVTRPRQPDRMVNGKRIKGRPGGLVTEDGVCVRSFGSRNSQEQQMLRLKGWYPNHRPAHMARYLWKLYWEIFLLEQQGVSKHELARRYGYERPFILPICLKVYTHIQRKLFDLDHGFLSRNEVDSWRTFQREVAPFLTHPKRQPAVPVRMASLHAAEDEARRTASSTDPTVLAHAVKDARQAHHERMVAWNPCALTPDDWETIKIYIDCRWQRRQERLNVTPKGGGITLYPLSQIRGGKLKFPPHIRTKKYFRERQAIRNAIKRKEEQEEMAW